MAAGSASRSRRINMSSLMIEWIVRRIRRASLICMKMRGRGAMSPRPPEMATIAEEREDDRGVLRSARGIIFAILLGVALW